MEKTTNRGERRGKGGVEGWRREGGVETKKKKKERETEEEMGFVQQCFNQL